MTRTRAGEHVELGDYNSDIRGCRTTCGMRLKLNFYNYIFRLLPLPRLQIPEDELGPMTLLTRFPVRCRPQLSYFAQRGNIWGLYIENEMI